MRLRWKVAQAAEIKWWENYLKGKSKKDYLAWKRGYWKSFLETLDIKVEKGVKVLDAGSGPAGIFTILDQQEVLAIDPLMDQYREKIDHFDPVDYPNTTFVNTPLESFDSDKNFDFIFCLNVINHVDNLDESLDRLVDSLGKEGTFVLSIDAHNHSFFKGLFRLLPGDILHPHQYDLSEYTAMAEKRNLSVLKTVHLKKEFFFDYYALVLEKKAD